jgi:hypothetical protein
VDRTAGYVFYVGWVMVYDDAYDTQKEVRRKEVKKYFRLCVVQAVPYQ